MRGIDRICVVVVLLAIAVGTAGCGDSEDEKSSGATGATNSREVTEAKEVIQHASTPPTRLTVTEPLPAKPKPGESVYYIGCGFPVCDQIFEGIKAGSETLGWKATKINIDQSNPATINSGVEQAIQNGATIVIQTGNEVASFEAALRTAKERNVLFLDGNTNNPQGDSGIQARVAPTNVMLPKYGELVGNLIVADSNGKAKVGFVRIKTYDNIFQEGFESVKKTLDERCPSTCTGEEIIVGVQDFFNQKLPGRVVSYLQSHPDINYLVFGFGTPETGVVPALQEAGLTDIKLTGFFPEPAQQAEIEGGASLPWPGAPLGVEGWQFVDAAARIRQHVDMEGYDQLGIPVWMINQDNLASATDYANAPEDYAEQFKRLWKVTN